MVANQKGEESEDDTAAVEAATTAALSSLLDFDDDPDDEAVTDDAVTDDAVADNAVTGEVVADNAVAGEAAVDETVVSDVVADVAVVEDYRQSNLAPDTIETTAAALEKGSDDESVFRATTNAAEEQSVTIENLRDVTSETELKVPTSVQGENEINDSPDIDEPESNSMPPPQSTVLPDSDSNTDVTNSVDSSDVTAELPKPKKTKTKTKKKKKTKQPTKPQSPPSPKKPKRGPRKTKDDEELIRLALHRNPYFTCLDEEQIERFIDEAELVKDFRPGQAVIVEGPSGPHRMLDKSNTNTNNSSSSSRRKSRTRRAKLRRWKTNAADVHGDDYLEGATTVGDPTDSDDPWWVQDDDEPQEEHAAITNTRESPIKSSYVYVIRNGKADVFFESVNPATLGPSKMFGEGGFLFGRNHSASVVAATDQLECFRVDRHTFVHKILPSQNMKRLYRKYASSSISTGGPKISRGSEKELIAAEEKFFMTMDDFLEFFKKEREGAGENSSSSLSSIANAYQSILRGTSSTYHDEKNHITLEDFCFFQFLMARPDPEIDIVFLLMDRSKMGTITRRDFEQYLETSAPYFDREGEFVERHFGQNRDIRASQFSQFLHDLQLELGRQAFLYRVKMLATKSDDNGDENRNSLSRSMTNPHVGYLPAETFIEVLKSTSSWRLPDGVIDRLESLYCKPSIDSAESTALASVRAGTIKGDSPKQVAEYSRRSVLADLERRRNKLGTRHFTYVDFIAFQDLLVQLPAICNLIERSCQIKKGPISPDDFKVANRVLGIGGRLSRQQVNIVFDLFDLDHDGYLSNEDAISVCGLEIGSNVLEAVEGRDGKATFAPPPNYPLKQSSASDGFGYKDDGRSQEDISLGDWMMTQTTQFLLSSIAGGFGMFMVYPLDLIKTRMMNQRAPGVEGPRLYQTSLDCVRKVVRYEGFQGLYRGLFPPLLAAGPEKFVKFTLNDMLRAVFSEDDGSSSSSTQWFTEIVSGGCAGACQLLVTNPLEIVKIRMQMQGETAKIFQDKGFRVPKGLGLHYMSFTEIVRDFGVTGLYKGAAACLMRDIPFGAIYFPAYAACMDYFVNREGSAGASSGSILLSGTLAAVPASLLTNPMDLVKTRLQVASRPGEEIYGGIGDCIRKVHEKEGTAAFFKGSFPRVARIAPQFGLSLFAYEKLSQLIGFRGIAPPTNAPVSPHDYQAAFSTNMSSGIESKAIDAESLIENIGLFKPPR